MIAWWWLPVAVLAASVLVFVFFAHVNRSVIQESVLIREENERLHRRIQLIGERRLDGAEHGQGER